MGNTLNTYGKPVISPTPTQTVVDMQAIADFADTFANVRRGTAAQRGALTAGQIRDGLLFSETDTGRIYLRKSGTWALVVGALSARMKRSSTGSSVSDTTWNQNLSLNALWDQDWRDTGVAAYNNGWTIPVAGEWEIDWGLAASNPITVGFTINKTTISNYVDLNGAASGFMNQGVAVLNGSKRIRLAAGDVIRLFGAADPTATWHTTTALSWFGIRYVGV